MRKSLKAELSHASAQKLIGTDFHDFLVKHTYMNEAELGVELGLTKREIDALKSRLQRG